MSNADLTDGLRLARAEIAALQDECDTLRDALRQALQHLDESVGHNDDCVPEARAALRDVSGDE